MKKYRGLVLPILILLFWIIGSEFNIFNSFIIPSPFKVFSTFMSLIGRGVLIPHIAKSLFRVFLGFLITFIIAFPLAIIVGSNKKIYDFLIPSLEFIRHIPPIAMIPLLILWFGIGEASKLGVIILATFFPIFINTFTGVSNCDKNLIEVGKTFEFSKLRILLKIVIPNALPEILSGMRLGLGYSWRALMGAELIAASSGIGYMIIEAEQLSRIDIIFVGIIVIGFLGYIIDYLFFKLTEKFLRWEKQDNDEHSYKKFNQTVSN